MREFLLLTFVYAPVVFGLVPWAIHAGLGHALGLYDDLPAGGTVFVASYAVAVVGLGTTMNVDAEPGKQFLNFGAALLIFAAALIGDRPAVDLILFGAPVGVLWFAVLQVLMWILDATSGSPRPFPYGPAALAAPAIRKKQRAEAAAREQEVRQRLETAADEVVALVAGEPGMRVPVISEALGLPVSRTRPLLEAMIAAGRLRGEQTDHGMRYYPVEPGGGTDG